MSPNCQGNWTADTDLVVVLNCIWSLLLAPDMDDSAYNPIYFIYPNITSNIFLTQLHYSQDAAFELMVRQHVATHASKGRLEWAAEMSRMDSRIRVYMNA